MSDKTPEPASIFALGATMLMVLQERHGLTDADMDAALAGALQHMLNARAGDKDSRVYCQGALDRLLIAWCGVNASPDKREMN